MPPKIEIDKQLFIEKTKELIDELNLNSIHNIKLSRSKENFWSRLSISYYNFEDYNKAKLFKKYYDTNREGIAIEIDNYIRNKNNLSNSNVERDKAKENKCCKEENSFSFEIPLADWVELEKFKSCKNRKIIFTRFFHEKLNKIVQSNGINCYLVCLNNHFNKKKTFFWNGKYKCKERECLIKYNAFLSEVSKNKSIQLTIEWNGKPCHGLLSKPIRCSDLLRNEMKLHLMAKGQSVVSSENFIKNLNKIEGDILNDFYKFINF
jgi:hypothetical protein